MPAGIETNGVKSTHASFRTPAWHGLGTVFTDILTPRQMLEEANMTGWNIRGISIDTMLPPDVSSDLKKIVVVRDNPFYSEEIAKEAETEGYSYDETPYNALGVVGSNYTITQNEELGDFGSLLLEDGRGETAGSTNGGRTVFMSIALETETKIDPEGVSDTVKQYLMISTSHDGTGALVAGVTPVRVVCQNTLQMALRAGLKNRIKIRHTKSMQERMNAAAATRKLTTNYITAFEEEATEMFQHSLTDNEFDAIIKAAYPEPKTNQAATTRWLDKRDTIMGLWNGPTVAGIKNTAWGALNALTEDQQWNRLVYNNNMEPYLAAGAGFDDSTNKERDRLAEIVRELALV